MKLKKGSLPARHGDVAFVVAEIPSDAKPVKVKGRYVTLALGEATGHAHVIDKKEDVELFEKDGVLYLRVNEEAPVKHVHLPTNQLTGEHKTETLPKGDFQIRIQQEVQPDGVVRPVVD